MLASNYIGLETTTGTAVAPTRVLLGDLKQSPHRPFVPVLDNAGWLIRHLRGGYHDRAEATLNWSEALQVESLPLWCAMAFRGNVAPAALDGSLYRWEFTPDDGVQTAKAATVVHGLPPQQAGANLMYRYAGAEITRLRITADVTKAEPVQLDATLAARNLEPITPLGGLPSLSARSSIAPSKCSVWLDDGAAATWPPFGQTVYAAGVEAFDVIWTWPTRHTFEPHSLDWLWSVRQIADVQATITARVNLDAAREIARWQSGSERLLRLQIGDTVSGYTAGFELDAFETDGFEGVEFGGGTPLQHVWVDLPGVWVAADPIARGSFAAVVFKLAGHARRDTGWHSRVSVVTNTASLAAA